MSGVQIDDCLGMVAICAVPGLLENDSTAAVWGQDLLKEALLVTFQSLLLESSPIILKISKVLQPDHLPTFVKWSQAIKHHLQLRICLHHIAAPNDCSMIGGCSSTLNMI